MPKPVVYLDYAASAPLRQEAREADAFYLSQDFAGANPNSLHSLGRGAAQLLEEARRSLVSCVGASFRPHELIFTSGGTEANNLALLGIAEAQREKDHSKTRVLVSSVEHDSVLDVATSLHRAGFSVDLIPVNSSGRVCEETLEGLLDRDVALVSIMYANNETGVINELVCLAELTHRFGAKLHTDAIQAFGHVPLALGHVDAVSLASHKLGGPLGIGALLVRSSCPITAQLVGGGQERGVRAGTQDVRAAWAFAQVAKSVCGQLNETREIVSQRAQMLYDRLCSHPKIHATAGAFVDSTKLPGIVSVYVNGIDSESLILQLDAKGFAVSAGSACSSSSLDPSHVLLAMGIARNDAFGSLRISFDERVDEAVLESFASALIEVLG